MDGTRGMDGEPRVWHHPERSSYELWLDGEVVGEAEYRLADGVAVFFHTIIDRPLRGQGLGAELVRGALDDVRRQGHRVVARCWYVADFLAAHPEYADLRAA